MTKSRTHALLVPAVVLTALLAAHATAQAQAWVGEKGSLSGSTSYTYNTSDSIIETTITLEGDPSVIQTVNTSVEYVPLTDLALEIQVPVAFSIFQGEGTNPIFGPHGDYDDGDLHGSLTDFRFNSRYALLTLPVALAANLGFSIPMMDYETQGFGAPGRGLKQAHAGLAVGGTLHPWVPRLFAQASYEFSLVESLKKNPRTKEFSQNYSRYSLQAGYLVLDTLALFVSLDGVKHHGGINFEQYEMYEADVKVWHDSLIKESATYFGAGASYQITDNINATLAASMYITGENTRIAKLVNAGLGWQLNVLDGYN